jgi:outer membrane protein assembly factor BamE (lipoprotein component of BamABCDE complex)
MRLSRRTRWALAVGLGLAVAAGVAVWLAIPRRPTITAEQFAQVRKGMTQQEVEAVLGCPPGDYRDGASMYFIEHDDIAKREGHTET